MLGKWKRSVNSDKTFGALLADLSKAFDCFDHELYYELLLQLRN